MVTSSLPGGPADKAGTNYEILWGLHGMLEVVQGRSDSIRIEPPGVDGAEFFLLRQGKKEHWQTKRQVTAQENWSLQKLKAEGVLEFFLSCAEAGGRGVFASISDAPELRILSSHARSAKDLAEFKAKFLTRPRLKEFAALRAHLHSVPEQDVFAFLREVNVHCADEGTLEEQFLHPVLIALFHGPAISAQANLSAIYLGNVHQTLTRVDILTQLEKAGILLREVAISATVRDQLRAVTNEYIAGQRAKLISRALISRKAARDAVDQVLGAVASLDILISSTAGGGKSACFFQIASELVTAGVPVFAFRLDRLKPTLTTSALGDQMGLSESPALVLARAYPNRPVVLIVDQLDFVSAASGRHPDFFDALAALVEEVRGLRSIQTIHLLLACREFDYEHDHRFRSLLPRDEKPIKLDPLSPDEVQEVVKVSGGRPDRLGPRQIELLRVAQNLALFIDSKLASQDKPSFLTQKDLFDAYWDVKKRQAEAAHPADASHWQPLLRALTDEMSRRQELSVSRDFLDLYPRVFVDHLVSSGVLTFNGKVYGFGHESFFDYCFARNAVARVGEFAVFLDGDDQLLFRRAQLRQVLVYLRDGDRRRYLANLGHILNSSKIRPHLKLLALELVSSVPDPIEEEFEILRPFLDSEIVHRRAKTANSDKIASRVWDVFFSSRSLFLIADKVGLIRDWLRHQDVWFTDLGVTYLRWQLHDHADRVAELIEPFESRPDWRSRLQVLVEGGDFEKGRRYFDLVLRLLKNGILDEVRAPFYSDGGLWTTAAGLAEAQPTWAAELGAAWLDRQVVRAHTAPGSPDTGIQLDDDSGIDDLALAAKNAPAAVLKHVLPSVLRTAEALPYDFKTEGLKWDRAWSGRYLSEDLDLPEAYLQAVQTAFASISLESPEALRVYIDDLSTRELDTANSLLFAAFECHPQHFADEALALLATDPRRFYCALHGSRYWLARRLIEACSPHCSPEVFREIEFAIINFAPERERTGDGYKYHGLAAFTLASVLDPTRTVDTTKTKLVSWQAKLGRTDGPPDVVRVFSVVSPITESDAAHMTDDQWLRAMDKYRNRGRDLSNFSRGGPAELASVLGTFVAKDPDRFANLAHRFPANAEANYLCAVIRNLKGAAIPSPKKIDVARLAFNWPPENATISTLELLGSIDDFPLPEDAVAFIRRMAFEGPGPSGIRIRATSGGKEKQLDIRTDGLNTVRGHAIDAIALLVFHDRAYLSAFGADIEKLAQDPNPAVRACAAFAAYAMASHDPARSLALLPSFFDFDVALHSSEYVWRLISRGVHKQLEAVRPYVHRLLNSPNAEARSHGGTAACLARLYHTTEDGLAETALTGTVEARRGAAVVAESNLLDPKCRPWCEQTLRRLFNDSDQEVRIAAAHCFWQLWKYPNLQLAEYSDLIEKFLNSAAFTTDPSFLLHALDDSKTRLPEEVLTVCEIFVERCAAEARDSRTGISGDEHTVGKLVFRAVAQLPDIAGQRRAISIIDSMCLEGLHSARRHLGEFER